MATVDTQQTQGTRRLLMTRLRAGVAVGLTAFVFALAVRDVLRPEHPHRLLLPLGHGSLLAAVNVVFYAYLCWLAFSFIRGTQGRERVVMAGWFAAILPLPLEILWPASAIPVRYIEMLGLLVALLAAVAILLDFTRVAPSADGSA